ncbi:MAG TPA: S24 family peptidase [Candidatus Polarisedimenticolia bacterium]|nr:S24 family peptidase [Candidatus Polarisedimenticolia bacterium]
MLPTRRQKAVLEAIEEHLSETGQTPTLLEIAKRCGLSSVATVHRHLALLQERGLLKRRRSRRRGIELRPAARSSLAVSVPLLGFLAAEKPIEPIPESASVALPRELVRRPAETFALRVKGDSLRPEQILDGDLLIAERREQWRDGEAVVEILAGGQAVLRPAGRDRGREPGPDRRRDEEGRREDAPRVLGVVTGLLRRYD